MRQRIFIGVLITLIFAMVSLHLLVGKRAVNPLLEEVTAEEYKRLP